MSDGPMENRPAVLLVGHGTRDAEGLREFQAVALGVAAALPGLVVESCMLELAEPTIAAGVERLAARGMRRFVVLPVLLFAGGHARRDIPEAVAAAVAGAVRSRSTLDLTFGQAEHLGCQPSLVDLSVARFHAARRLEGPADSGKLTERGEPEQVTTKSWETGPDSLPFVVLVGRGGSDLEAIAEMHRFVALRMPRTPAVGLALGFLAGAGQPTVTEALDRAERSESRRIVVQPHLLFQGRLVHETRRLVAERARARPDREWRIAAHLGPAAEVIATLVANYRGYVDIATSDDSA